MARLDTRQEVKNSSPKRFKKILSEVANFIIYDKSGDYAAAPDGDYKEYSGSEVHASDSVVEFVKTPVSDINTDGKKKYGAIRKKYIKSKKRTVSGNAAEGENISGGDGESFAEIFDSVKKAKSENAEKRRIHYSYGYGSRGYSDNKIDENTKTTIPAVSPGTEKQNSVENFEEDKRERGKINFANPAKRIIILVFSVICGSITMPFGMNPLGISIICAADKYIFYIYSGLVISLAFYRENSIVFLIVYTVVAGVKFYLRYNKEKAKIGMLSESISYNNLSRKEKVKLQNLVHFNDTGSVIMSVLVCAVACCVIGFIKIALKIESVVYTDIAVVMLFMLVSMLFTYLYSGLFDVGADNGTLERAGICAVIFTVIYFLAPFYLYTLSIGYIVSFMLTFIAANSGKSKIQSAESVSDMGESEKESEENKEINYDEEIISRFAVNLINHDGALSDMTRGALVGLLCGVALGDTAGAVTLGICGLVSGLFFSQSAPLAIISGLISAVSYSVYVAGIDAVQRYIPNMLIGFTVYLPASMFYFSLAQKVNAGKYGKKSVPFSDKGLLITELPAGKLNSLSDAFHGLSEVFYEISDRFKNPNSNEIKAIVSACIEKTCAKCENHDSCALTEKSGLNSMQKKCVEFLFKNGRLTSAGVTEAFADGCIKISEIQNKINAVYCSKTEENIENNKTKIFADNYENIAKLLRNNIKSGKDDISFKKDMSEKIFVCLGKMGIECENVIVMGERKKTVYIFDVKMVNYAGTIADITDMLEGVCGTYFDSPEYILRDNYIIMKNQSRNKFRIYSVQMSKAAEDNEFREDFAEINNSSGRSVNGDSVSIFHGKDGYQYGLISDGMGSGKSAALSSGLTVLLTEKLLSAGNQKDLTIEMINSLLMSKSDECFASVDLFEADLITGKASFIKAGAAPSFVIRNGKLFKIQSSTVPAGIIENINSEQTKFDMEDGDYIIMLSDGIISTFEEGAWLLEMLGAEKNLRNPKFLLNCILREAAKKNQRKDDMSVLLMKVTDEKAVTGA